MQAHGVLLLLLSLLSTSLFTFVAGQVVNPLYQSPKYEYVFTPLNQTTGGSSPWYNNYPQLNPSGPYIVFGSINSASAVKAPNRLYNGLIFEGEEVASSPPSQATALNLGQSFGLGMWINIEYITGTHTLFCKQRPTILGPDPQLCLSYDATKFFWQVKDTSTDNLISINRYGSVVLDTVPMTDMTPQVGWQYVHFNIWLATNVTAFEGYYFTDSLLSYNATKMYRSQYLWTDSNLNTLSIGGSLSTATSVNQSMVGIINHMIIWTNPIGKWQIFDQYSYKCQPYCSICKVQDMPKCIQQYERSLAGWYDFAPPKYYYSNANQDLSQWSNALNAMTPDTQYTEPTLINSGSDPIHADRQGLYFQDAQKLLINTASYWNQAMYQNVQQSQSNYGLHSITVEAWVRFMDSAPTGFAYVFQKAGSSGSGVQLYFTATNLIFKVNGFPHPSPNTASYYSPRPSSWYYIGGSVMKFNNFQSRLCVWIYNQFVCNTYDTIFREYSATLLTIGQGFIGVINKVKVFQYPKILLKEAFQNIRYNVDNTCIPFNKIGCTHCDIDQKGNDTNFRYYCNSNCLITQWYTDCRACNSKCRSCFDADEYHCHSCIDKPFDHYQRATRCIEECGDGKNMAYYECDDGNLNVGDGCDNWCRVEKGFKCVGGTPNSPDVCTETCGDSRRVYQACDDGNTVSGDGCSSTCTVEYGYTCLGGSLTTRDVCFEKCGDGLNMGSYKCDDGNTINGDGCSSACQVEIGWKCVQGSALSPTVCKSTCGDGIVIALTEPCDDGNLIAGDGCSSTCGIEYGWNCFTDNFLVPSFCYKKSSPQIIDYYTSGNNLLYIVFNETIMLDTTWLKKNWQLNISGPIPPYDFNWSVYQNQSLMVSPSATVILNLTINSQLYGLEQLSFAIDTQSTTLSGTYKTSTVKGNGFIIMLGAQDDPTGNTCGTEVWRVPLFYLLYANLGIAMLAGLLLQSTTVVFHLIGCIQILSLTAMYQAVYPTCLVNFLKSLSVVGINFTMFGGSIISGFVSASSFPNKPPDYKFPRMGINTTSAIINAGDLVFMWVVIFGVYCIAYAIEFVLHSVPYIRNVCQRYRYNCINVACNFTYLKMMFYTGFGLLYINLDNKDQYINSACTLVLTMVVIVYPIWLAYQGGMYALDLRQAESDDKVSNSRSNHVFVEFRTSHPTCYFYPLVMCIKKGLFVAIALTMFNYYCYALMLSGLIQFLSLMYISYTRPFKSSLHNVIIIFEDAVTLLAIVSLFRYGNEYSVVDLAHSQLYAKYFAILAFILTTVPSLLALIEILRILKDIKKICNWNRDYQDEKEQFDSSEEELNETDDLLKNQVSEDSMVEKEISISSSSDDQGIEPEERELSQTIQQTEPEQTFNETQPDPDTPPKQQSPPEERKQPTPQPQQQKQTPMQKPLPTRTPPVQQPTKQVTPQEDYPPPKDEFKPLDFSNVPNEAANTKERLPDLK